jgi:hypothetical protein
MKRGARPAYSALHASGRRLSLLDPAARFLGIGGKLGGRHPGRAAGLLLDDSRDLGRRVAGILTWC